jgi:hypothetical protein
MDGFELAAAFGGEIPDFVDYVEPQSRDDITSQLRAHKPLKWYERRVAPIGDFASRQKWRRLYAQGTRDGVLRLQTKTKMPTQTTTTLLDGRIDKSARGAPVEST